MLAALAWGRRGVLVVVMVLGVARPGHAAPLFRPPAAGWAAGRATAWALRVAVDPGVAASLARQRRTATIEDVPLAGGGTASFRLAPIEIFAPGAAVVEFDGVTARPVGRPDVSAYEGEDVATPGRRIVLSIADGARVWAVVREGGTAVTVIHPLEGERAPEAHAVVDPRLAPGPVHALCTNHTAAPGELAPLGGPAPGGAAAAPAPPSGGTPPAPPLAAEVLVDVGNDLYVNQFGSSTAQASTYAASLVAAVSGMYRRDVNVAVLIGQLVVWTTPDPFAGVDTSAQLSAYAGYNVANRGAVPRDTAHLLANLGGEGGRAYLGVLCDTTFGYGVSNLDGFYTSFPSSGYLWDVYVVAHELGHNFGSPHTHCYVPPLDQCYNQEAGCYGGPVVLSVGETMSYCHLNSTVEMGFGAVVGGVIRAGATGAACIGPAPGTCGDGTLDAGEQCDDANTVDGDCCSATCAYEGPTTPCTDDGDPCTSDVCAQGVCAHVPPGLCSACSAATVIPPGGGTVSGTTSGSSTLAGTCGSTEASPEQVFAWTPAASGTATATTCAPGTSYDTVLYVRAAQCDVGTQVACSDDDASCSASARASRVTFPVTAGQTVYLVVDGFAGAQGAFTLQVTAPVVCGDGIPAGAEECDDGNADPADGCTNACTICGNGVVTPPETCDDGNLVGGDACTPTCTVDCPAAPLAGCRTPVRPARSKLLLKDQALDAKDLLKWSWANGAATTVADFGSPLSTDAYLLCLYDAGGLALQAVAPAGGVCGGKPCWSAKATGFGYKDTVLSPDGLAKIGLKAGVAGTAKILVLGKGVPLATPALATLVSPVRAQLARPGGPCWEAVFSAPFTRQEAGFFLDSSD